MVSLIKSITPSAIIKNTSLNANLNFIKGDILNGTVLKKIGLGNFLVSSKGCKFQGHTSLNLMEGGKYKFQVNANGSRIELKVLDGTVQKAGLPIVLKKWIASRGIRNNIISILSGLKDAHNINGLPKNIGQSLEIFKKLLPTIIYNNPGKSNAVWFERALMKSGLFWENRVLRYLLDSGNGEIRNLVTSDLKGILLSLQKCLQSESQEFREKASLFSQTSQLLGLIEKDQLLNFSSLEEDIGWFWFIPGKGEDGFEKAELFVRKQQEEGFYFSILLEFTHLGQIEADVSMVKSTINVKMRLQDAKIMDIVTKNLYLLEKGLQDAGFATGTLTCELKEGEGDKQPFSMSDISSQSVHIVI